MNLRMNKKPVFFFASVCIIIFIIILYNALPWSNPCGIDYLYEAEMLPVLKYCNSLGSSSVAQEGSLEKQNPGLRLLSVHAVIRHGDRHSMHGFNHYARVQLSCDIDENVTRRLPKMRSYQAHMRAQQEKGGFKVKDSALEGVSLLPDQLACGVADLTPIGAAQHVSNGLLMSKRYGHLLDPDRNVHSQVLVRSTTWPRCFQSALALLYGLLGDRLDMAALDLQVAPDNRMCIDSPDQKLPCSCGLIDAADVDQMSPTYRQMFPEVMDLPETSSVSQHFAEVFGIGMSEVPAVGHLFDVTMGHVCHALPLPAPSMPEDSTSQLKCIQPWAVQQIKAILDTNGHLQAQNAQLHKICKLKLLPLLSEISTRMAAQQEKGNREPRFVLYSGHDSTVEPLSLALGFGTGAWPPFASRNVFELYSTTAGTEGSENSDVSIRVLYNGFDVTKEMDWCRDKIDGNGLCPFEVFQKYVDTGLLESVGETDYVAACSKHDF